MTKNERANARKYARLLNRWHQLNKRMSGQPLPGQSERVVQIENLFLRHNRVGTRDGAKVARLISKKLSQLQKLHQRTYACRKRHRVMAQYPPGRPKTSIANLSTSSVNFQKRLTQAVVATVSWWAKSRTRVTAVSKVLRSAKILLDTEADRHNNRLKRGEAFGRRVDRISVLIDKRSGKYWIDYVHQVAQAAYTKEEVAPKPVLELRPLFRSRA